MNILKNIKEKEALRAEKSLEMTSIVNKAIEADAAKTAEEETRFDELTEEIKVIDSKIENLKYALEAEKLGGTVINTNDGSEKSIKKDFISAFKSSARTGAMSTEFAGTKGGLVMPNEVKATITTSTDAGIIRSNVAPELSIVTGDNFTLLQSLGVKFYPMLNSKLVLNSNEQAIGGKPAEGGADPSTAGFDVDTAEISAQEYSNTQTMSQIVLLEAPDEVIFEWIADMAMAGERDLVADYFAAIIATDASVVATAAGLTYGDMVNLTKINYNIGTANYVTGTDVRVYLEQLAVNSGGTLAWNAMNNTIASRNAVSSDAMGAKKAIYGNHAKGGAVGLYGDAEVLITRNATTPGKVDYGVARWAGTAVRNKRAFKHFSLDASVAV